MKRTKELKWDSAHSNQKLTAQSQSQTTSCRDKNSFCENNSSSIIQRTLSHSSQSLIKSHKF